MAEAPELVATHTRVPSYAAADGNAKVLFRLMRRTCVPVRALICITLPDVTHGTNRFSPSKQPSSGVLWAGKAKWNAGPLSMTPVFSVAILLSTRPGPIGPCGPAGP